jgi:adenine-specific DNA-methyltransferase
MATRRRLLSFLTRAELLQLAADYEHSGLTAKPKDEIIDAIVQFAQPSKPDVLGYFSRAQLKSACEELGLDTTGREKQALIDRLLGREDDDEEEDAPAAQEQPRTGPKPGELPIDDYRHDEVTRKNIPPAKLAAEGRVPKVPPVQYAYNPRRPPALRFDSTGAADAHFELLDQARLRPLTEVEALHLRDALAVHEPWLEWAGKQESDKRGTFTVDPVALHIHERVSAQAILKIAARQDVERTLFGDPEQAYHDAVQFYRHDMDWTNRLILGDSLQVMASLATREDLAGQVQMIYIDPPYGIRFASNFQPLIGQKDVKEQEKDLTRESEMIRAYRDTWTLGVHSYIAYLRERLIVARHLLADSGSVFIQIGDDNLHRVRTLLDEVFGPENAQALIVFRTSVPLKSVGLAGITDYVLWYAKDASQLKRFDLFLDRKQGDGGIYVSVEEPSGHRRSMTSDERSDTTTIPDDARVFGTDNLVSSGYTPTCIFDVDFEGRRFSPTSGKSWKTNPEGMARLIASRRVNASGSTLRAMMYVTDYPVAKLSNLWTDVKGETDKEYVVQTPSKVVQRCMLMSTEPGDLVLDPTCGSGTLAAVAEQWGRRWITIDTSRVAIAVAKHRVMTSTFDYYRLRDEHKGPSGGIEYRTVPHVTLNHPLI